MTIKPRKLKVGRDSVVIGDVNGEVGDGSVVIGPTDARGNTIIDKPMAVGRGASAGPGSIAIGAGASAGSTPTLMDMLNELSATIETTGDESAAKEFNTVIAEVTGENGSPSRSKIDIALNSLRNMATLNGVLGLIDRIQDAVSTML